MPCSESGHIYIVQGQPSGLIKIGKTSGEIKSRLSTMRTNSPERLELLAYFPCFQTLTQIERAFHNRFARDRVHGEWFKDSPELEEIYAWGICGPRGPDDSEDPLHSWVWPCPGWNIGPVLCPCCDQQICSLCGHEWWDSEGLCEGAIRAEEANTHLGHPTTLRPEDRWKGLDI